MGIHYNLHISDKKKDKVVLTVSGDVNKTLFKKSEILIGKWNLSINVQNKSYCIDMVL